MRDGSMATVCLAAACVLAAGCVGRPQPPGTNDDSGGGNLDASVGWKKWQPPASAKCDANADGGSPADAGGSPPDAGTDGGARTTEPSGRATVRLDEIDYDQPGPDDAEFVEMRNTGARSVPLDGLALVMINGADGGEYGRVPLEGDLASGAFAVVAAAGVDVAPGALRFDAGDGFLQNGPDGVALVGPSGEVIDTLAYEAPIVWSRGTDAGPADVSIMAAGVEDTGEGSLVRVRAGADGASTASADGGSGTGWQWAATPTPGAPNPG